MVAVNWKAWQFLIGDWAGEWHSESGSGIGSLSISPDLQGRILVRKTHVDFSSTTDHPAYAHDDLFVIRQEEDGSTLSIYFDDNGRIIHTRAEPLKDDRTITFISEASPVKPQFRFTYLHGPGQAVTIRFEISPPGTPGEFSVHTEGIVKRRKQDS